MSKYSGKDKTNSLSRKRKLKDVEPQKSSLKRLKNKSDEEEK